MIVRSIRTLKGEGKFFLPRVAFCPEFVFVNLWEGTLGRNLLGLTRSSGKQKFLKMLLIRAY